MVVGSLAFIQKHGQIMVLFLKWEFNFELLKIQCELVNFQINEEIEKYVPSK